MKHHLKFILLAIITMHLVACTGIPKDIQPVAEVKIERYLGKWYEIVRLDHSFERGLSKVIAEYSVRGDGGIKVVNRGWDAKKKQWKRAEGKAYRISENKAGHFKVSFFGPFYGSYIVFELGENYDYAFVSGNTKNYLWLLSRKPKVSDELLTRFKQVAKEKGFNLENLVLPQ